VEIEECTSTSEFLIVEAIISEYNYIEINYIHAFLAEESNRGDV
jgi:hypothetical protein